MVWIGEVSSIECTHLFVHLAFLPVFPTQTQDEEARWHLVWSTRRWQRSIHAPLSRVRRVGDNRIETLRLVRLSGAEGCLVLPVNNHLHMTAALWQLCVKHHCTRCHPHQVPAAQVVIIRASLTQRNHTNINILIPSVKLNYSRPAKTVKRSSCNILVTTAVYRLYKAFACRSCRCLAQDFLFYVNRHGRSITRVR